MLKILFSYYINYIILLLYSAGSMTERILGLRVSEIEIDPLVCTINPLTPKSDWHLIFPYTVTFESHVSVQNI